MKNTLCFLCILAIMVLFSAYSCKKNSTPPVFIGTVIGFDQCNGRPNDSSARGYVVKVEKINGPDTTVIDTAMTYNLPKVFVFHPQLFVAYQFTYLFPPEYQNKYKLRFSYIVTPKQDMTFSVCTSDIWLAPVEIATKNEQITITKFYGFGAHDLETQ